MFELNVGRQFSLDPSGRFYTDGPGSGEEFREEHLLPALFSLKDDEKLTVILDDGVEGYGSSFLVESFAAIVKFGHMTSEELLRKLMFKYSDPDFEFYEKRIVEYIAQASFNSKKYICSKQ